MFQTSKAEQSELLFDPQCRKAIDNDIAHMTIFYTVN